MILDSQGVGTITNDDAPPIFVSIGDVTQAEGNSGTTLFTFTVTLSSASSQTISVNYATADGTAISGTPKDFTKINNSTLTFAPGEIGKTITVSINGDTATEPNETFFVNLTNAVNSVFADDQGLGTILDDDGTLPATALLMNSSDNVAIGVVNPSAASINGNVAFRSDKLAIADSVATEHDRASFEAALAAWADDDLAEALCDLGALTDDGDKNDLQGEQGDDELIGGIGDKLKQ